MNKTIVTVFAIFIGGGIGALIGYNVFGVDITQYGIFTLAGAAAGFYLANKYVK